MEPLPTIIILLVVVCIILGIIIDSKMSEIDKLKRFNRALAGQYYHTSQLPNKMALIAVYFQMKARRIVTLLKLREMQLKKLDPDFNNHLSEKDNNIQIPTINSILDNELEFNNQYETLRKNTIR